MDRNKRFIFLFTILLGVFFIGAYYALSNPSISSVTVRTATGGIEGNFSILGGTNLTQVINFTITVANDNVTNITFVFPTEYYPVGNGTSLASSGEGFEAANFSTTNLDSAWAYINTTSGGLNVVTFNGTNQTITNFIFSFNVTAKSGNETSDTAGVNFTIFASNDTDAGGSIVGVVANTTIFVPLDTLAPRILSVNLTDGNSTLVASSSELNGSLDGNFNENNVSMELRRGNALTVNVEVVDLHRNLFMLVYNVTGGNDTGTSVVMTESSVNSTNAIFSGTIPAGALSANGFLNFHLVGNDSLAQTNTSRNPWDLKSSKAVSAGLGYNLSLTDRVPAIVKINVTDGTNILKLSSTGSSGLSGGGFLKSENHTVKFVIQGYNTSNATFVYNFSADADTLNLLRPTLDGTVVEYGASPTGFATNISQQDRTQGFANVTFNFSIPAKGNNGKRVHLAVIANDTQGYHVVANFSYKVDGTAPSASLNTPSDLDIANSGSISYTCTSSDTSGSGVKDYTFTLTKPKGGTITKTSTDGKVTFTGTDTNELGQYSVKCEPQDNVGNKGSVTTTDTNDFVVLAGTGGGSSGGGGGGGSSGSGSSTVGAEADQETEAGQVTTEGTNFVVAVEGTVNFNLGTQSHSARVVEISGNTVTVEINSHEPVMVTLEVGESKEVDVDHDGSNDVTVTLNRIVDGKADLTFISTVTPEEAQEAEEQLREEAAVTPEVPGEGGNAGVIITIIVILAILIIGYFVLRKK